MLPTKAQQQAIEAKLNFVLGADIYDRLFLGFVCGAVDHAIVGSEYSWHVAVVVESVLKQPVKRVNVLPKNTSQAR